MKNELNDEDIEALKTLRNRLETEVTVEGYNLNDTKIPFVNKRKTQIIAIRKIERMYKKEKEENSNVQN